MTMRHAEQEKRSSAESFIHHVLIERSCQMVKRFVRFMGEAEGATAPEYGLMVALIAVVIIASVTLLGTNLTGTFTQVAGAIGAAS